MPNKSIMIGALEGKVPYTKILQEFSLPLAAIGLVHRRGARKYAAYSWLHDPEASNSTIWENIDAMLRHMTAHSIGMIQDPEGLPHIYHMCCRAGMLVTTYLREQVPDPMNWSVEDIETIDNEDDPSFGCWITPEEILALAVYYNHKDYLYPYYNNTKVIPNLLQEHIYSLLLNCAMTYNRNNSWINPKEDIFDYPTVIEDIFISTMIFAQNYLKNHKYTSLVNNDLLSEDDKEYCELYLR